jgi:hypothetical protein
MTNLTSSEIVRLANATEQDEQGQFKQGSEEHQFATRFVELFFYEHESIVKNSDEDEYELLVAAVVNAMRDLQVRDYMMGIVYQIKNSIDILESLIEEAPKEYANSAIALVSTVYYENDRVEDAINTINEASEDYSLANLLKRIYSAGWPKESFARMRSELHPKVTAGIFGEGK